MPHTEKYRQLADEIRGIFRRGITIDREGLHFIEAMGWETTPAFLKNALSGKVNEDVESLIELVFYPDKTMQCRLEPLLEAHPYSHSDKTALMNHLLAVPPPVRLFLPGETIHLPLPADAVRPFISRLRITLRINARLTGAINRNIHQDKQNALKVQLRNTHLPEQDTAINFLCRFLKIMGTAPIDLSTHVGFILSFLTTCGETTDYTAALFEKRQRYINHEKQARQFHETLAKSNMETLMLQGTHPPAINESEARRNITIIDEILHSLQ